MKARQGPVAAARKESARTATGILSPVLISFISAAVAILLFLSAAFYGMELKSIDLRFRVRGESGRSSLVSIVAIDEKSEEGFGEKWPWRRLYHASLLDALTDFGVKAAGFDVFFTAVKEDDEAFRDAIARNGHVHLGEYFELGPDGGGKQPDSSPGMTLSEIPRFSIPSLDKTALNARKIFLPNDVLLSSARGAGFAQMDPDMDERGLNSDGVARKYPLLVLLDGRFFPSLALSVACDYFGSDLTKVEFRSGRWVIIPKGTRLDRPIRIPVDREGQMIVNWTGRWESRNGIAKYSFFDICESRSLVLSGLEPTAETGQLQGRVVLIGDATLDSQDRATVPFQTLYPMVGFQANALNTILEGNFLRPVPLTYTVILTILLSFALAFLIRGKKTLPTFLIFVLFIGGYFGLSLLGFSKLGLISNMTVPAFALFGTFVGTVGYSFEKERKERQRISSTFGKYVSPDVMGEILKNRRSALFGEKREVSILFSDVRGFTTISETLSADELVPLINEYLTAMTDIIFAHGGTVNKFVGDAIMALFGAPVGCDDHADRALRTSLAMMEKVREISARWKEEGKPSLDIGIGINTGIVFAGNVGSVERMEYTVMGDGVNVASRLESLNKDYGTHIIASAETMRRATVEFKVRDMGAVSVKGRKEAIQCYEVLGAGE